MTRNETDIRKIAEIIGDKYHQTGSGAIAAVACDGGASHTFDGDAGVVTGMLVELAAIAIVQASRSQRQMRQGRMEFVRRLMDASDQKWEQEHRPAEVTAALEGAAAEKLKEALLN